MLGYVKVYFGLPYRQTEGLIRTYHTMVPSVPDYTAIHKRINRMDIKVTGAAAKDGIILAVDSTGIKITNRGDWMRHKWSRKRRGFLKIHVDVDVSTNQVLAVKITDEHSHDSRCLKYLTRQSARFGRVEKLLGDGAYDSREIFSFLDGKTSYRQSG
jgi:IS5 family transposase